MADSTYLLDGDVWQSLFQADIGGTVYSFRLLFEPVDGYWYLSILDEAATVLIVAGRRLTPFGPWLKVAPRDQLTVTMLRHVYGLAEGLLPGSIFCVSSAPLTAPAGAPYLPGQIPAAATADAEAMQLNWYSDASLTAALVSGVLT